MAHLTKKQLERYRAKGKIAATGKSPVSTSSTRPTTNPTPKSPPSRSSEAPARNIFDTPQAREHAEIFNKATDQHDTDFQNIANRMFDIVLAKQQIYSSGPTATKDLDVDTIRTHLFELLGSAGWERTLFFFAQCARLWAELPGPVEFTNKDKAVMHGVSSGLTELCPIARVIDERSTRPGIIRK